MFGRATIRLGIGHILVVIYNIAFEYWYCRVSIKDLLVDKETVMSVEFFPRLAPGKASYHIKILDYSHIRIKGATGQSIFYL